MPECFYMWMVLLVLSAALLASLCLNLKLCILRRKRFSRKEQKSSRHSKSLPQIEEAYSGDTNYAQSTEENSHSLHLEQENPIYGNIITNGTSSIVYEAMNVRGRDRAEASEPDLNYASLDLKLAMKRKKRHQHSYVLGQTSPPDQLQVRHTPPESAAFLDEACLPLRDQNLMVSHSSIYLNSQQIDQEREDSENVHWQTTGGERTDEWSPERENQTNACSEDGSRSLMDEQDMLSDTDHFVSSHIDE